MSSEKNLWWGYKHISGTLQAKRYWDVRDTDEARESPFVDVIVFPFFAKNREEALSYIKSQVGGLCET